MQVAAQQFLGQRILEVGGKGHSVGIASFDDGHIHRLASMAPVSRIMVRQVQSSSNAGTFTNGMPMTSSMGCGIWGGNMYAGGAGAILPNKVTSKHNFRYQPG